MKWVDLSGYNARLTALKTAGKTFMRITPTLEQITDELVAICERHKMLSKNGAYAFAYTNESRSILLELTNLPLSRTIDVSPESVGYTKKDTNHAVRTNPNESSRNGESGQTKTAGEIGRASVGDRKDGQAAERTGAGETNSVDEHSAANMELSSTTSAGELGVASSGGRAASSGERVSRELVNNPDHHFLTGETVRQGGFSAQTRFEENKLAIMITRELDEEGRLALPEEKVNLAKFNGWGGLSPVFQTRKYNDPDWVFDARIWTQGAMEAEEYASAKQNTLSGHYTSPQAASAIWAALEEGGFKGGRVFDPAAGTGVFLGTMPEHIVRNSFITTVEKDRLTASILRNLYPDAKHHAKGLEAVSLRGAGFDLAITNVPFGDFGVADPDYNRHGLKIHDYFIVKSLDSLKPGGIGAFITSRYTMDKVNDSARRLMAERGELIGAIRMPSSAQKAQANVEVVTDILVFRRREIAPSLAEINELDWLRSDEAEFSDGESSVGLNVNRYFLRNPNHVLGLSARTSAQFGRPELAIRTDREIDDWTQDISEILGASIKKHRNEFTVSESEVKPKSAHRILNQEEFSGLIPGSFAVIDGKVSVIAESNDDEGNLAYQSVAVTGKAAKRIIGMVAVRDAMNSVIKLQVESLLDSDEYLSARDELNKIYDQFVKTNGFINLPVNAKLFREDPESGRVRALEMYNAEEDVYTKADIFTKRIIGFDSEPNIQTPIDAMNYLLSNEGSIDIDRVAELASVTYEQAVESLLNSGAAFKNPSNDKWEVAAKYLSGDVKTKLEVAEQVADENPFFTVNVEALKMVIPEDIVRGDIVINMGASWLEADLIEGFVKKLLGATSSEASISVKRLPTEKWLFQVGSHFKHKAVVVNEYGTMRMGAIEIIEKLINGGTIAVYDRDPYTKKAVLNESETMVVQQKAELINEAFEEYLFENEDRADLTIRLYNDAMNRYVSPEYDGSMLTFPGMSATIELRDVQKNSVMRYLQEGRELLAHEVGVGKTYTMIACAIEAKRLGLFNKPMIAVPNNMIEQIEREGLQLYPNAKVLAISRDDLKADKRKTFMGRVANNDWDLIVTTHGVLGDLPVSHEFTKLYIENQISSLMAALEGAEAIDAKPRTVKQIQNKIAKAQDKLETIVQFIEEKKDQGIAFEDLGVDMLAIDEYHNYKNLETASGNSALSISGSMKATDLEMKVMQIFEKNGRYVGVLPATGTPVSNSIAELHVLMRYFQPDILADKGMETIDSWAQSFIRFKSQFEPAPGGNGFKLRERPVLVNAPELMAMVRSFMDVRTAKEAGIKRPEHEQTIFTAEMTTSQEIVTRNLAERADRLSKTKVDPKVDNILKIVSEGRQVALHANLIADKHEIDINDDSPTKIDDMIRESLNTYHATTEDRGAQAIFCDMGTPSASRKGGFNVYDLIKEKLIDQNVPEEEIAFAHDAKTDKAKGDLFAAVREGKKRFILGSTSKMGEGINMQERLAALHHLDPPWRPSDIVQRNGRILRFGNIFQATGVNINIYTTKGSFDEYMWTTMKAKNDIFSSIMSGDKTHRVFDDGVDPTYAETVAIVTRNPLLKEKMEVEQTVNRLSALSRGYDREVQNIRKFISNRKETIEDAQETIDKYSKMVDVEPTGEEGNFRWFENKTDKETGESNWVATERDTLSAKIGKFLKKHNDSEVLVRFEDQDVLVYKEDGHSMLIWKLDDMNFTGSASLQRRFELRDVEIENALKRIAFSEQEIVRHKAMMDTKGPNPFNDDLKLAEARLHEIEDMISNGNKNLANAITKGDEASAPGP